MNDIQLSLMEYRMDLTRWMLNLCCCLEKMDSHSEENLSVIAYEYKSKYLQRENKDPQTVIQRYNKRLLLDTTFRQKRLRVRLS